MRLQDQILVAEMFYLKENCFEFSDADFLCIG